MIFWGKSGKIRKLEKELEDIKKQFWEQKRRVAETNEELQQAEIHIWNQEKKIKSLEFQEHCVKDQLKHEFWERIYPVFFLQGKQLRSACEQGTVYYSEDYDQWVVVESYCVVCGKEIEYKKFGHESDALRYAAIR